MPAGVWPDRGLKGPGRLGDGLTQVRRVAGPMVRVVPLTRVWGADTISRACAASCGPVAKW